MGKAFGDRGDPSIETLWVRVWRLLGGNIEPQKHDCEILAALGYSLDLAIKDSKRKWGVDQATTAILVVTGDIVTSAATSQRIDEFPFAYLTSLLMPPEQDHPIGLGVLGLRQKDSFFVPGNHERFGGATLELFANSQFGTVRQHQYHEYGKFDYLAWVPSDPRPLLVVCLDTGLDAPGVISRGEIGAPQLHWVRSALERLASDGDTIDGYFVTPAEYKRSVRILTAHHCVCPKEGRFLRWWERHSMKLLNRDSLDGIMEEFHIALFGHVHRACRFEQQSTIYVSAGSVAQKMRRFNHNSFSIHCVREDLSLATREYTWAGGWFKCHAD